MSGVNPFPPDARLVSLDLEDIGVGWKATLRVEPRLRARAKRSHLLLIDRWHFAPGMHARSRQQADELLAEAILQRRLPGID